ncbi:maleylpyruvate isomerase family mycothiol-dependent enzyme [Streptomyces sp. NPDC006923]|uniref:maleylpyruvate isomerase family mycothiol-dependent enzyme n=1 Tax=Streptomyces sp. NPDC006923 TaxID=3155355 RepID=UPI0034058246
MSDRRNGDVTSAMAGLTAMRRAQSRLDGLVAATGDGWDDEPSLLPGWKRRHVVAHLARNADGVVNLLTWAATGIEHPMYGSPHEQAARIEESARQSYAELREDYRLSGERFWRAAGDMPTAAWSERVAPRAGIWLTAAKLPWLRLGEILIHAVDLDCGFTFADVVALAGEHIDGLCAYVVGVYAGRPGVPAVELTMFLPSGEKRLYAFGEGRPARISGSADSALAWLTGRSTGDHLDGPVPALPTWLV